MEISQIGGKRAIGLPGAGHDLQGLGDIFAKLGQASAAAAGARRRAWDADTLTRQSGHRNGLRDGRARVKPVTVVRAAAASVASSSSVAAAFSSSSCSSI
jgi:hypothetical protein